MTDRTGKAIVLMLLAILAAMRLEHQTTGTGEFILGLAMTFCWALALILAVSGGDE